MSLFARNPCESAGLAVYLHTYTFTAYDKPFTDRCWNGHPERHYSGPFWPTVDLGTGSEYPGAISTLHMPCSPLHLPLCSVASSSSQHRWILYLVLQKPCFLSDHLIREREFRTVHTLFKIRSLCGQTRPQGHYRDTYH